MLLKQTTESSDRKAVFYPEGKNSAVQLGSYQEMVSHRGAARNISFMYKWDPESPIVTDPFSNLEYSGQTIEFEGETGLNNQEQQNLIVKKLMYHLLDGKEKTLSVSMEFNHENRQKYRVCTEQYLPIQKKETVWQIDAPVKFYGFPPNIGKNSLYSGSFQEFNLQQEKLFESLFYLAPMRNRTERIYQWTGITPDSVGFNGENTVSAILAAKDRKIGIAKSQKKQASRSKPFEEIVARNLKNMDLIDDFKVTAIQDNRKVYEVKIKTKGSEDWVDLPDTGFGISQVLPVLVQCFYAPRNSIIIIEQPEIHLHPAAQSALADVMIDAIHAKENGKDRNIQLIIETHSEHFLRRLQRRIAEDVISEDEIAIYFANINKTPASLDPLEIDEYGTIKNWPQNFFGDEMGDIAEQSKAALKKRINRKNAGGHKPDEQTS
jgi:hypothetical protein